MAISFPTNPNIGDTYSASGKTWTWNGSQWEGVPAVINAGIPSGETGDRPTNPSIGDQFYNGTLGVLEIYTSSGWLPATGANDFNIVLTGSETSVTFDKEYFSGAYTITSTLSDTSFDLYLFDTSNNAAGYTNTPSINATSNFNKIVVYGGTAGDLLSFTYKTTFTTSTSNADTFAAPYMVSISDSDLPSIDDATTISGGNFDTDIQVWFDGANEYSKQAKSVVYGSSTSIVATRPDDLLSSNAPYTIRLVNPGIPQPVGSNTHKLVDSITAGDGPTWVTNSGRLFSATVNQPYSTTLQATDPEGGNMSYSISSGSLPNGLSLNSTTGEISGTPIADGSSNFVISAIDEGNNITNRSFQLSVVVISGGTAQDIDGYRIHTFTSSDTLNVLADTSVDFLIVAGGGGGGGGASNDNDGGGAGGAGGLIFAQSSVLTAQSYSVVVGAGGSAGSVDSNGVNGTSSIAFSETALPGGFGGKPNTTGGGGNGVIASGGGSGGGGSTNGNTAAVGTSPQGNNGGGKENSLPYQGAGGGGHSQAGVGAFGNSITNGGSGTDFSAYFGSSVGDGGYFAGGGGGGAGMISTGLGSNYAGSGGLGGGGNGGSGIRNGTGDNAGNATSAIPNTGGGGGGGSNIDAGNATTHTGGNGGSGIVIVRYPI